VSLQGMVARTLLFVEEKGRDYRPLKEFIEGVARWPGTRLWRETVTERSARLAAAQTALLGAVEPRVICNRTHESQPSNGCMDARLRWTAKGRPLLRSEKVILLDVDGTLLDDERIIGDLRRHMRRSLGIGRERHYVTILNRLHARLGYADYLGALQRYRLEHPGDPEILRISCFLIEYPFQNVLKPGALRIIRECRRLAPVVIVSDGDAVFQPHKIMASGIWKAARNHVLVFVHKDKMLKAIERLYPARHYFMVEDKPEVLASMKKAWKKRVTTVLIGKRASVKSKYKRDGEPGIVIPALRDLPQALRRHNRGSKHV